MKKDDLHSFLNPRSIAIIGASENVFYSRDMIANLARYGRRLKILPINPHRTSVLGFPCFPSIKDVEQEVDLVVIAVGRDSVLQCVKDCESMSTKNIIILSTGFAEADEKGKGLQNELAELASSSGMNILGPNCLGFLNMSNSIIVSPLPSWRQKLPLKTGRIGLVSQSGGIGAGLLFLNGYDRSIGFSHVITTGNEAGLDATDFMEYLIEDSATGVIALAMEGLKRPKRFLDLLRLASENKKPVVILKTGQGSKGSKAALSHTGAITGSKRVFDAAVKQSGALIVDDFEQLLELASLLEKCPPAKSNGVAIITTSGGLATHLSDLCEEFGLPLPEIEGTKVQSDLLKIEGLLTFGMIRNPADIRGQGVSVLGKVVESFVEDDRFSVIVVACEICGTDQISATMASNMIEVASKIDKPMIAIWTGNRVPEDKVISEDLPYRILENSKIPLFHNARRAMTAIKLYTQARHTVKTDSASAGGSGRVAAHANAQGYSGILSDAECISLLASYGIPVAPGAISKTTGEALSIANTVRYPVAVKVSSRDIPHLTDAGALRLNVATDEELIQAYNDVIASAKAHKPEARIEGVYVQKMAKKGVEVIVGVSNDELFGPCLIFGLGGIFVEALNDTSIRLPPLSTEEAERMIKEIKGLKILQGFRDLPKTDITALAGVISRVSLLAKDLEGSLLELDLNPLIVMPEGGGVEAVDFLLRFK